MAAPKPVFNPASPVNPNVGYSVEASSVGDWYVHLQTVDIMYIRRNQYDSSTSSVNTSPVVTSNWLDMNATVQTQDEIYYDVAFSSVNSSGGLVFEPHVLQLQSNGSGGGFGDSGIVSTSAMGIVRRLARKDARGTILDTTGICTENSTMVMDQMPGAYNSTFDTSSTVNGILAQAMGQVSQSCPTFKATLVDL
tara:strand:+ start:158 stop:739 length:582 start_codon:yes stop_codon:yes gene_type:complete